MSLQFLSTQEKRTCEQLMEKLLGSLEVSGMSDFLTSKLTFTHRYNKAIEAVSVRC